MNQGHARRSILALTLFAGAAPALAQPAYVEFNGVRYEVLKGPEGTRYSDGAALRTMEALRAHVAAQRPRIVTPALSQRIASARAPESVEVTVLLRSQPTGPIAREEWAGVKGRVETIAAEMRAIAGRNRPGMSLPPALERAVAEPPLGPADANALRALASVRDDLERDARLRIAARAEQAVKGEQDRLAGFIASLGGAVTSRIGVVNVMGARVPAGQIARLAAHPLVAGIDLNHPGEPELNNSRLALGVDTGFWAAGIMGGTFDAGVLDTGVQQNHPALSSHTFLSNLGVNDTQSHGTLMAGIMASTDASNRGMAFGLDKIVVALAGDINTSMPGMAYIAGTGEPEAVNYSFGNGTANLIDYSPTDQFFDAVIDTFGFTVSKSTGNGGFGSGNPTITFPAPAYNLLACANLADQNTPTRADDRISSSSSRGPTAGGRKKPDIGAPGTSIMSCNSGWAGGSLWSSCTGTSCAAPHVGAAVILLFDAGVQNVAAAKAVLINTADAMNDNNTSGTGDDTYVNGSFWNRRYGWGYMNLAAAYTHRADVFTGIVKDEPAAETFKLYAGQMFTHEKATLTWQRHVAYNGGTFPTQIESQSDLDLRGYRQSDGVEVAASASAIDNVEQFSVTADAQVVLKVKAAAPFDPDVPEEEFALATQENFTARNGPALAGPVILVPTPPGSQLVLNVTVRNDGDLTAFGVSAAFSGMTVLSGPNPAPVGTLGAGQSVVVQWTIDAPTAGNFPVQVALGSNSYAEAFSGLIAGNVVVGTGNCYPDCNGDLVLNLADFGCFQTKYALGDMYADCNGDQLLNLADFGCFQTEFAAGCP